MIYDKPHAPRISIHAPTRGATIVNIRQKTAIYDFNPRAYTRSDKMMNIMRNKYG